MNGKGDNVSIDGEGTGGRDAVTTHLIIVREMGQRRGSSTASGRGMGCEDGGGGVDTIATVGFICECVEWMR